MKPRLYMFLLMNRLCAFCAGTVKLVQEWCAGAFLLFMHPFFLAATLLGLLSCLWPCHVHSLVGVSPGACIFHAVSREHSLDNPGPQRSGCRWCL